MRQRNDGHVNSILANCCRGKESRLHLSFTEREMRGREGGATVRCNAQGRLIRIIPHFEERREEAKVTTPATERQRERVSVWGRRAWLGSVFVVAA